MAAEKRSFCSTRRDMGGGATGCEGGVVCSTSGIGELGSGRGAAIGVLRRECCTYGRVGGAWSGRDEWRGSGWGDGSTGGGRRDACRERGAGDGRGAVVGCAVWRFCRRRAGPAIDLPKGASRFAGGRA